MKPLHLVNINLWLNVALLYRLGCSAAAEDEARRAQRAEVARVMAAVNGSALAEPCWATARTGGAPLCVTLDEALAADVGGLATVGVVVAWCADDFHWVADFLRMVARGLPKRENITRWRRLVVYQKCVVSRRDDGKLVAGAGPKHRVLDFEVTGPDLTLAPDDVRRAARATVGPGWPTVAAAIDALEIRVARMVEPGRSWHASTDEAGAVLHYLSENYDDLNDATFFAHGHIHGELGPLAATLRSFSRRG